jgi:hypothetical protein
MLVDSSAIIPSQTAAGIHAFHSRARDALKRELSESPRAGGYSIA